jgi:hypothetical protein
MRICKENVLRLQLPRRTVRESRVELASRGRGAPVNWHCAVGVGGVGAHPSFLPKLACWVNQAYRFFVRSSPKLGPFARCKLLLSL